METIKLILLWLGLWAVGFWLISFATIPTMILGAIDFFAGGAIAVVAIQSFKQE